MIEEKLKEAFEIAHNEDVSSAPDSLVLYSISYLPTKENRDKAFEFVKKHPNKMMIEYTDCGAKLCELGLSASDDDKDLFDAIMNIWAIASRRFILQASGDVTAFVDGADTRSTFVQIELPNILKNPKILHINGIDKFEFAKKFIPENQE